ncbi:hypothetical protein ACFL6N_00140 [Thermodesulfobacteriota bacterium]
MKVLLILLAAVPIGGYFWSRKSRQEWLWTITGVCFGLVVAPLGLGFMDLSGLPIIGKLFGLIGMLLNLVHGLPGFIIAVAHGIHAPGEVLSVSGHVMVSAINGVAWAFFYGVLGFTFDKKSKEILGS